MGSSLNSNWPKLPELTIDASDQAGSQLVETYWQGLQELAARDGIPGLMAELTRINGELQRNAQSAISSTVASGQMMDETLAALDRPVLRLRQTASPSPESERGQAARQPSPEHALPPRLLRSRSGGRGLGAQIATRIALAQLRSDIREER